MIAQRIGVLGRALSPIAPTARNAHRTSLLVLGAFLCALGISPVFAQSTPSCTVPNTTLAFGDLTSNLLASQNSDITGTISYSCTGTANDSVKLCIALSYFTGATRDMASGANNLTFQIYSDASRTVVFGNQTTPTILTINATMSGAGTLAGSATMYGRALSGQTTDPPGSYSLNMAGSSTNRLTATTTTGTACGSVTTGARQFAVNVTATISSLCLVSASNLNFGSQGVLAANVDQTTTIQVQCTNTTPYNIGLNAGTGTGASVTTRKMTSGGNTINYSLYRDAARSQVWGTTIGTNTSSATGSGATQSHTVYGRVAPQATPAPSTYSDTITVTVTY
jgi:spore coat protein U-like protein